eukprot:573147-Pelagomonas_calceolata.AAC.3
MTNSSAASAPWISRTAAQAGTPSWRINAAASKELGKLGGNVTGKRKKKGLAAAGAYVRREELYR